MTQPSLPPGVIDLSTLSKPVPQPPNEWVENVTDATFPALVERSKEVPVVLDLWADWCGPCKTLGPILESLAEEYAGRFVLAKVDVDRSPQISAAFQVQSIPAVFALIAGQPLPLFHGALPAPQVRKLLDQLIAVSAENGVGSAAGSQVEEAPEPPPLPPLHQEGLEALERGDFAAARAAYSKALTQNPSDGEARAALAQVELMDRLDGVDPAALIAAASEGDVESQLAAADGEFGSGQMEAAFERLLALIRAGGQWREPARARLVEYFNIVGPHESVTAARRSLASALN